MTRIVVVGSINLDLSASTPRLPQPGETVTGATLSRFPGGKGANQALAAKRLGADVRLIGCVGEDAYTEEALALLRAEGVELDSLKVDPSSPTGVAMICVDPSGENTIVVAPGANTKLSMDSVLFDDEDALICQLEVPVDTVAHAAKNFEGFFTVNLAPTKEIDVAVLQRADLVIVNEVEAAWYGATLSACSGYVATTFGAAGAVLELDGDEIARASAPRIHAVDTVGAGDSFTAALTVALVEKQDPADALRFACAAGACAASKPGAQTSLPTRSDVVSMLEVEQSR